jgi:hypothetical protein
MCRSIRTLRGLDPPASTDDVHAAALQFVRKVSGYRAPSAANQAPFDAAVDEITAAAQRLLADLRPGHAATRRRRVERSRAST